jgi:hypothetical protein
VKQESVITQEALYDCNTAYMPRTAKSFIS